MTIVVDASVVIAALLDNGENGRWSEKILRSDSIAAPEMLLIESVNVLRRLERNNEIEEREARLALDELITLPVQYLSMLPAIDRIIALRHNVTAYDATYIAVAEWLRAPLATLDIKLSRVKAGCEFLTPA